MVIGKHTSKARRRTLAALGGALAILSVTNLGLAQDFPITGPLAGAEPIRKQRLYREGRFEVAPAASFTLLDEYQRTILFGARLNYNFTDWLALGVWGAHGTIPITTGLSDRIQDRNQEIKTDDPNCLGNECRLTAPNLGPDFADQLAAFNWVAVPQLTVVPFRGKIALFQSLFLDTDLYFFVGAAFINVTERADCGGDGQQECANLASYSAASRTTWTISEGLGLTFYINEWSSFGTEFRLLPFSWNTAGFDTAGGGPNGEFPNFVSSPYRPQISEADRQLKFNPMMTVSFSVYLPFEHRISQ